MFALQIFVVFRGGHDLIVHSLEGSVRLWRLETQVVCCVAWEDFLSDAELLSV